MRILIPILAALLAILTMMVPTGTLASALPAPHLLLAVIFFFTVRRPEYMPPLLVFALGLLADCVTDGPIGAETVALLIASETARPLSARDPAPGLLTEWGRFAITALLLEIIVIGLMIATFSRGVPYLALVERLGLTILSYPLVMLLLGWAFAIRWRDPRMGRLAR
ncbi:MAG: rod shape-determining protein MreD [Neomegalonema sp.]|nr:rod shape-determining protein MreD [Neomegalonema sp.]